MQNFLKIFRITFIAFFDFFLKKKPSTFRLPDIIQSAKSDTITATAATIHLLLGCNIILVSHLIKNGQNSKIQQNPHKTEQTKKHHMPPRNVKNYARPQNSYYFFSDTRRSRVYLLPLHMECCRRLAAGSLHLFAGKKEPTGVCCRSSRKLPLWSTRELVKKIKKGNRRMSTVF